MFNTLSRNLSKSILLFTKLNTRSLSVNVMAAKQLNKENFRSFLDSFDTVLTDCDGVLWNGTVAIEGAPETFVQLKKLGKRIFPVTNNSTKTRQQYVEKCLGMGFPVEQEDIISSAYVTANYLKDDLNYKGKKVYCLGSAALAQELKDVGYEVERLDDSADENGVLKDYPTLGVHAFEHMEMDPEVGCVVIGFDAKFNFLKLARGTSYLQDPNCLFLATNTDSALPLGTGRVVPGTGSLVASLAYASEREPIVCGKPHHPIFDIAHEKHNVNKETTIMIGDRLNTDIELAHNCDLKSLLVMTGIHKEKDVQLRQASNSLEHQRQIPDFYVESFGTIGKLLNEML